MSSPAESTSGQQPQKHGQMPVDILFCPECSNMLYPKEDKEARKLMYQCRTCQHTQEATSNCVYRNILKNLAGDTAGVTQDVAMDPTVGAHDSTGPSTDPNSSYFQAHALAMCGCCGQIIMCSDCDVRPAFIPAAERATTANENLSTSIPPKSYQAELMGPMMPASDVQISWSEILDEVSRLNIVPADMDMDLDMDDDDFFEDWEPELEEGELVHGPPNKPISA